MKNSQWQLLTFPSKEDLSEVRQQCHQAIQNVAAVGRSFLAASDDDVHANLEWDFGLQRLVGRWVETDQITFRSSFSISEFTVYLVDDGLKTLSSFELQNKTQTDVMVWLEQQLGELGFEFSKINLAAPYKIPEYVQAKGAPFIVSDFNTTQELSKLYHNAAFVLRSILNEYENTTVVKCWPHHFDIAGQIIELDTGDPATTKSIGLGLSPGDQYYDEPYFYFSPWPYPMGRLPDIAESMGHWHDEDWVGAVLPISKLAPYNLIQDQRRCVERFYKYVYSALKRKK